ncbi:MAG: hypothetical protein M1820_009703 [Bogoriella megaspora]|nr:MAG: hypothetical protein M1820_009703 [Bogoriella megaspora]
MPPRYLTNPAPQTESARQAIKSFFCDLCQKGYARFNEYEAHQSSYDHQHRRRMKDLKAMSKDPEKIRRAEQKANLETGMRPLEIKPEEKNRSVRAGWKKLDMTTGVETIPDPPMNEDVPMDSVESKEEDDVDLREEDGVGWRKQAEEAEEEDDSDWSDEFDPSFPEGKEKGQVYEITEQEIEALRNP